MLKAYKYKCKVNKTTVQSLDGYLEMCRQVYNACIIQRQYYWHSRHEYINYYEQKRQLVAIKKEWPEYYDIPSNILQDIPKRVDMAYKGFFARLKNCLQRGESSNFPNPPRIIRYNEYTSMTLSYIHGFKHENNVLTVTNKGIVLGRFKLISYKKKPIEGKVKTVTISKENSGYYVVFTCELPDAKPVYEINKIVGLNVGITHFIYDSNGDNQLKLSPFRDMSKKLRIVGRKYARTKRGSTGRQKQKQSLARVHRKVSNIRKEKLHELSKKYAENYDAIVVEDLKINSMISSEKNRVDGKIIGKKQSVGLNKSILDSGWGIFISMLEYKLKERGKLLIKVPPQYTSQDCSACKTRVPKKLSVRIHECPECGLVLQREENAALNILHSGLDKLKKMEKDGLIKIRCSPVRATGS